MKAEYVNPFLDASSHLLDQICHIKIDKKPLFIKHGIVETKNVTIIIGINGDVKGNLILNLDKEAALTIASGMMGGYPVNELDEITTSAVSEFCNMVAGHSGMYFAESKMNIDITPPTLCINSSNSTINYTSKTICVPITFEKGEAMEIDVNLT